jgi:hypothetical protein
MLAELRAEATSVREVKSRTRKRYRITYLEDIAEA